MGEERTLYESESQRTIPEVIDFLQQLAQWLGDRRLAFDDGEETMVFEIPHNVVLEIEIEEEDQGEDQVKRSLEIEIEWIADKANAHTRGADEAANASDEKE